MNKVHNRVYLLYNNIKKIIVWEAETRKRLEAAIEVVNDCFDELCKAETRDGVFGDLYVALVRIDDAMRVYERGVKRIDKRLSCSSNESKL